jgi:hypothetical protein
MTGKWQGNKQRQQLYKGRGYHWEKQQKTRYSRASGNPEISF